MRRRGRRGCLTWTQEGNAINQSGEGLLSRVGQRREDALTYQKVKSGTLREVRYLAFFVFLRFLCCSNGSINKEASQYLTRIHADRSRGAIIRGMPVVAREAEVLARR